MTLPSHSDVELLDLAQLGGAGLGGQCGSALEHLLSGRCHQVRAPGVSVKPEDVEGFSPLRGVFDRYAGAVPSGAGCHAAPVKRRPNAVSIRTPNACPIGCPISVCEKLEN